MTKSNVQFGAKSKSSLGKSNPPTSPFEVPKRRKINPKKADREATSMRFFFVEELNSELKPIKKRIGNKYRIMIGVPQQLIKTRMAREINPAR